MAFWISYPCRKHLALSVGVKIKHGLMLNKNIFGMMAALYDHIVRLNLYVQMFLADVIITMNHCR